VPHCAEFPLPLEEGQARLPSEGSGKPIEAGKLSLNLPSRHAGETSRETSPLEAGVPPRLPLLWASSKSIWISKRDLH